MLTFETKYLENGRNKENRGVAILASHASFALAEKQI
jgi:hypothetical protein